MGMPLLAQNFMVPMVTPVGPSMTLPARTGTVHSLPLVQPAADDSLSPSAETAPVSSQQALVQRLEQDAAALEQDRAALIAKSAWKLSRDSEGCRFVQQALEEADSDEARSALMQTLRGHVWEAAWCPHANHVLQKYIVTMKPAACQFIVEELMQSGPASSGKLARHKYGYRVFQRLLEHLLPQQTAPLVEALMMDCVSLSMHRFGTYVMQHVLEYGTDAQRQQVVAALTLQISKLSVNNDACMVLDAALVKSDAEIQDVLAQAILESDGAIGAMAHTRRGHVAVLSLLELIGGELLEVATQQLAMQAASLKKNRFGRLVLNFVQLHCGDVAVGAAGGA